MVRLINPFFPPRECQGRRNNKAAFCVVGTVEGGGREGRMGLPPMVAFRLFSKLCVSSGAVSCGCNDGLTRKDRSNQVVLAALTKPWSKKRKVGGKGMEELH